MGHDADELTKLAWIGADGGAVVLGINGLTDATLLADAGVPEIGAAAFLLAGGAGLYGKAVEWSE